MKEYKITQEQREEILGYIRSRNYSSAKNALNQLEEINNPEDIKGKNEKSET